MDEENRSLVFLEARHSTSSPQSILSLIDRCGNPSRGGKSHGIHRTGPLLQTAGWIFLRRLPENKRKQQGRNLKSGKSQSSAPFPPATGQNRGFLQFFLPHVILASALPTKELSSTVPPSVGMQTNWWRPHEFLNSGPLYLADFVHSGKPDASVSPA